MNQDTSQLTFGAYLKAYFKQCMEVFKHPKMLLPTAILAVIWIGLGILQNKVGRNLPLSIINFLTFAQGGLYGGVLGAIGGILGKIVVAAFVNVMIVPLFYKKNPFANLKQGFDDVVKTAKFESTEAFVSLLKGFGVALLLYSIFNVTQSRENSMVGIVSVVALVSAVARKGGFLWGLVLSWMNSVSKGKVPSYQRVVRALTGMSLGFTLGVLLSAAGSMWAGLLGLIALIVGLIMGNRLKKVVSMFLVGVFLMNAPSSAYARDKGWVLVNTDAQVTGTTCHKEEDNGYHTWVTDVSNIKATEYGFSFDAVRVHTKKSSGEKDTYTRHHESKFTPFQKSYQPGEKFNGEHRWSGRMGDVKIKVYGYIDTNNGNVDEQFLGPSIEEKGFAYCRMTFPPRDKVNGDRLVVKYVAKVFEETVTLSYVFEWNGKADASNEEEQTNENITILEWLLKLLDTDGTHAPDAITVIIGILGVLGGLGGTLGGGLGGSIGGAGGGGFPGGEGPIDVTDLSPEELEWQRYQKMLENLRKKWVHDNGDGTKTLIDPATGKKQTLYPKYNAETGEQEGWMNENDTAYTDESLNDWLAWRERNSEHFAQNEAEAQRNLEEQRAMNKAQNDYDRERGSSAMADKWKADKEQMEEDFEHKMRLQELAWKHGLATADKETLTKALLKDRHEALEEGAQAMHDAAYWNDLTNGAEIVEQSADLFVNIMGESSPQAHQIKNAYTFLKSLAKHGSMGIVKGQGMGEVIKELGIGTVEGGLSVFQNQEMTGVFGESALGAFTKAGSNVLAEMGKSVINDLSDPNKSAKDILDNLTKAGVNRISYEVIGKLVGGKADNAFADAVKKIAGNDPQAAKKIIEAWEGSKQVTTFSQEAGFHNTISNEIAEELSFHRQRILGV